MVQASRATGSLGALLLVFVAGCGGEPAPTAENPFASSANPPPSAPPPPTVRSDRLTRGAPPPPAARQGVSANGSGGAENGDPDAPADADQQPAESLPQFPEQDRAIEQATRQITEYPLTAHVSYNNRAVAYFEKGELEQALADLNKAIELKPDYAEAWHNRGVVHETLGEHANAQRDFARAKRLGR